MNFMFKKLFFKFFGLVFNGDCSMYDRHVWLKKNLVILNENSNLLDIGCGNGWVFFIAKKLGFKKLVGISWDRNQIAKISGRLNLDNLELLVGDVRQLDKINLSYKFDIVVNCENIEHIIDDDKLINDISNKLNNKGLLYLTTPNILFKGGYGDTPIKNPPVEDGSHVVRGYSRERLEKILLKNNLKIISTNYIGGNLSRNLLSLQRMLPNKILKIIFIPLSILANFFDNIFFFDNQNNYSIAIIAEKFET